MSVISAEKIHNDPRFQKLCKERDTLGWILSAIVCVMYFGFTLMIAYTPGILTTPIASDSVIPLGMPLGVGIIVMSCILTGFYVYKANNTYDPIMKQIIEEASK